MFRLLYPHAYVKSVFVLDYQKLYDMGFRGIIFDIDNTLVHHGEDSTPEVDALFQQIHEIGFRTLLLSNNNEQRICRFLKNIRSLYIPEADKPQTAGYEKAIEMLQLKKEETLFVGDQIFTDIYGANKSGIANVLVEYLRYEQQTVIGKKRTLEKYVLKCYRHSAKYQNRLGDICKKRSGTDCAVEER